MGIIITDNLKVSVQCGKAYAKANRLLGVLYRTIAHKTTDIMVKLYKTLIRPHLEYGVVAWSPHYVKDRELLERVQHAPVYENVSTFEGKTVQQSSDGAWSLHARRKEKQGGFNRSLQNAEWVVKITIRNLLRTQGRRQNQR